MANDNSKKASGKKSYEKPKLTKIGKIQELSQTRSRNGPADGGSFPSNKMNCLTPTPFFEEHRYLVSDRICQSVFRQTICKYVKKGDVVVDLGTGTGIHSLFALQAGARKVYAIDQSDIIDVAKENISRNGFSDKVVFIKGNSAGVDLPERADCIISNLGFMSSMDMLALPAAKWLKPSGIMLPGRGILSMAPLEMPNCYEQHVGFWDSKPFGFDLSAMKRLPMSQPIYMKLAGGEELAAFSHHEINFRVVPSKMEFRANFEISRAGTCHGVGGYYSFAVENDVFLTTKPPIQMAGEIWNNYLFPFESPIKMQLGDQMRVELSVLRLGGEADHLWMWKAELNGKLVANQSNFPSSGVAFAEELRA